MHQGKKDEGNIGIGMAQFQKTITRSRKMHRVSVKWCVKKKKKKKKKDGWVFSFS